MADDPKLLLTIDPLPARYDRVYKARARDGDSIYEVNLGRLSCTCPEFVSRRAGFPATDPRRVCEHIYDKLYSTKAEKELAPLVRLFIRYGRGMYSCRIIADQGDVFVVGQPFGRDSVRAIAIVGGRSVVATYDLRCGAWQGGETELDPALATDILERMRAGVPEAF